jgi:transcriptional regulator with XRE-family HTH domain
MRKTAGVIAKDALTASGVSQAKLAAKMGLKSQQALFSMLNAKNGMRVDNFVKIMDTLGYDVVIRNKVTDEEQIASAEGSDSE